VKPFIGTIYEFLSYNKLQALSDLERKKTEQKPAVVKEEINKEDKQRNAELRKELDKDIKKIAKQISVAEGHIEAFESSLNAINHELTLPEVLADNEKVKELYAKHSKAQQELDMIVSNWESLNDELEKKQSALKAISL
jgi:uncharacterized protein (DUF3084 family)